MNPETQSSAPAPLEPAKETVTEMSFGVALRRAIDDLFTHQAIADKLQAIPPNDVLPALLDTWKQGLTDRLHTEAQAMVENVAAILDLLQADEPLSAREPLEWLQAERWFAPFAISTICREDLHDSLTAEEITQLNDEDMVSIATQTGEALRNTAIYWKSLEIAARSVLNHRHGNPAQPSEPETATPHPEDPTS